MLIIVVADTKPFRTEKIGTILSTYSIDDIIVLDDTLSTIADLEQYLYPSLFTITAPLVHARFILDTKEKDLTPVLLKKLMASPTTFLFEELALSKPFVTSLKKQGIEVHTAEPQKIPAAKNNLFGVTNLVTMSSKKDRWMAYQTAIAQYPIEAILGMLYWKVRDLVLKEKDANGQYHTLYTKLLEAHATAWQEGTPLALAIEKTLLTY
ncbi:MAG: hypothetical protein JWL92_260 [Candidatus Nomurabacteria bacterium]|nr:hypothetical protein [Candidatus Nomurabacteria bacterium]